MHFGNEDVVRHKIVQRIVQAYAEHAERAAPELRPAASAAVLEVEVIGDALPEARVRELRHARARVGGRRRRATSRSSSSTPERIAELNAAHRGKQGPTDVLSFPIDELGESFGPRELGDVVICPEHTADLEEAVVHGVLHLTGMDHETDDGEMLALQAEILGWVATA